MRLLWRCKDPLSATLRSEQKWPCWSACQPCVRLVHFSSSRLTASLSTLDACSLPPPQTPVQDTCERITPLPTFTASCFSPFTFHFLYIFLSIRCNDAPYTHSFTTLLTPYLRS